MATPPPAMPAPAIAPPENPPYAQVPVVETPMALVVLLVNIFVPGIGTIIGGVVGNRPLIGRGIAQLVLWLIIVGWIWGIVTGVQFLQNATWNEKRAKTPA